MTNQAPVIYTSTFRRLQGCFYWMILLMSCVDAEVKALVRAVTRLLIIVV